MDDRKLVCKADYEAAKARGEGGRGREGGREGEREGGRGRRKGEEREKSFCGYSVSPDALIIGFGCLAGGIVRFHS